MDLKTNVIVKGPDAQKVYAAILDSSIRPQNKQKLRQERLAAFSKKIKASAK